MLRNRNPGFAGLVLAALVGAFVARAVPAGLVPATAQDEGDPRRKTPHSIYKSITVRYMAGQAPDEVSLSSIKRYGVESVLGEGMPKMLGLESTTGERVYVDASKILVIQLEPEDAGEPQERPNAPK